MSFDKSKFIEQFKAEAKEHLQVLSDGLLQLEKDDSRSDLIESLMRTAHTLKGAATVMGYKRIADVAHSMEDGLEKVLKENFKLQKRHFDALLKCIDSIEHLLEDKLTWEDKGVAHPFVKQLCEELADAFSGKEPSKPTQSTPKKKKSSKSSQKKQPSESFDEEPPQAKDPAVIEKTLRVEIDKLDNLMKLSGELIVFKSRFIELLKRFSMQMEIAETNPNEILDIFKQLKVAQENIELVSLDIQTEVMQVRMVPISYLFNTFPRAMRDLAIEKKKEVDLQIRGADAYLDKGIIDRMRDAILHILRNSIDHGIEYPDERQKNGKSRSGQITLNAYQSGSQVVIEISDDGQGVDVDKVRARAVKQGLVSEQKAKEMINEQILQFIFSPGFTTAEEVTDISGRGVGLDVVRNTVTDLKGILEILSSDDKGTSFIMKLPLTLSVTESLLLTVGNDKYAVPIESVVETVRITAEDIRSVETREMVTVRGYILPLVRLNQLFDLPTRGIVEKTYFPVVIVQTGEKRVGILVDEVSERQEIVNKSINRPLQNLKNISGATVLGDGDVVLILDIPSIIDSAESGSTMTSVKVSRPKTIRKRKAILLVEDSLSTATFEKNILESVGYSVVLAKDGVEAMDKAQQERFDLVISDVLMPRMDGFELTEKLRSHDDYKDTPIIIVTTRQSPADKKRGLDAGADAYILKSEFTSEGLLNTIDRLIG